MKLKNKFTIIIPLIILGALIVLKLFYLKSDNALPNSAVKSHGKLNKPVTVSVIDIKPSPIEEKIITTGTVRASKDIELRNEINGRVTGVFFEEGMSVKKGQLLCKISDSDLIAQLQKAQANLKPAREKELRQKGLLDKELISTEEYQLSLKDAETCEADVLLLTSQIEKTKIRAPFSGKIGLSSVNEGSFLTVGTKIANLISVDELEVESNITERYASSLFNGMKVTFTVAGNSTTYQGELCAIEPKIDDATRTVAIKARCTNIDKHLIVGSFAKIELILNHHQGILIPSNAIISDIEGYKVFICKDKQSLSRSVTTGFRNESYVEILSGINAGDSLITTGVFMLRPKMNVEIRNTSDSK